jgi:RHS repeat-associated protein
VRHGFTHNLAYDAENRLVSVSGAPPPSTWATTTRRKAPPCGRTTTPTGRGWRCGRAAPSTTFSPTTAILDGLRSTAITANGDGTAEVSELRYFPHGKTRYTSGTTPTHRRFTGQIEDATIGLYFYNARYYDPALGRFVQADTIVPEPGNPQDLNRYSYVRNNALRYVDPMGFFSEEEIMGFFNVETWEQVLAHFEEGGSLEGRWGWLAVLRAAEVGDIVFATHHYFALYGGSPEEEIIFGGKFRTLDGQLFIQNSRSIVLWDHEDVAQLSNYYAFLKYDGRHGDYRTHHYSNYQHYYVTKYDFSQVDQAGALYDVIGICTNYAPSLEVQAIGYGADLAAITMSWPPFAAAVATGAPSLQIADAGVDLALDLGGLLPVGGIVWDAASLAKNFWQNTQVYHGP